MLGICFELTYLWKLGEGEVLEKISTLISIHEPSQKSRGEGKLKIWCFGQKGQKFLQKCHFPNILTSNSLLC
jgi:hypothetical protein